MYGEITAWIEQYLGASPAFQIKLLYSLIAIVALLLLRFVANRILNQRIQERATLYRWRKTTSYLFLALGVVVIGSIWLRGTGSIATYLGLVSAALVIALQDPISDFIGWIFIISRRPFVIEDRIQIGGVAGDVIDTRFFQFSLMEIGNWVDADQSTGRVLHIPNRKVFSENIANYSQGFSYLWNEVAVVITFESDWRRAKTLLGEIAQRHSVELDDTVRERIRQASDRYLIYYKNLTPIVYTRVLDHGVALTIRYLCPPRGKRGTEQAIWEDILDIFAEEPKLDFAYPTQRLFYYPTEGPPELRPSPKVAGSDMDLS